MPANFSRELIVIKVDPDVDSIRENVVSGDLGDSDGVSLANPTYFRHDELDCCCGDRNANNERVSNQNEVIFMSKRDARRSSAQSDVKEAPYSSVLKAEIDDGDKINKKPKTEEDLEASSDHSKSLPRSSSKELRYHDQHDDQKSQSQPNTGKSQRRSGLDEIITTTCVDRNGLCPYGHYIALFRAYFIGHLGAGVFPRWGNCSNFI